MLPGGLGAASMDTHGLSGQGPREQRKAPRCLCWAGLSGAEGLVRPRGQRADGAERGGDRLPGASPATPVCPREASGTWSTRAHTHIPRVHTHVHTPHTPRTGATFGPQPAEPHCAHGRKGDQTARAEACGKAPEAWAPAGHEVHQFGAGAPSPSASAGPGGSSGSGRCPSTRSTALPWSPLLCCFCRRVSLYLRVMSLGTVGAVSPAAGPRSDPETQTPADPAQEAADGPRRPTALTAGRSARWSR